MGAGSRRIRLLVGILAVTSLVAAGCGDDDDDATGTTEPPELSSEVEALIETARAEGNTLNWRFYFAAGLPLIEALNAGFNDYYGLDVTFQGIPRNNLGQDIIAIQEEIDADLPATTDVIQGVPTFLVQAPELVQTVDFSIFDWIPDDTVINDGASLYVVSRLPGLAYNTDIVPEEDVPQTFAEFAAEDEYTIATSQTGIGTGPLSSEELLGEEDTLEVMRTLAGNVDGFFFCGAVDENISSGAFDMFALDCGSYETLAAPEDAPLGHQILKDAAVISYQTIGVASHTEKPALATLLSAYLLTEAAQDIFFDLQFQDLHLLEGSETAKEVAAAEAEGIEFLDENVEFTAAHAATSGRMRPLIGRILQNTG